MVYDRIRTNYNFVFIKYVQHEIFERVIEDLSVI